MKKLTYLAIILVAFVQASCKKDPLSTVNNDSGSWNNERSIKSIKFEHQVGPAEISRVDGSTGKVNISINIDAVPDLSNIAVKQLVLSYDAKSSVGEGDALNFQNDSNSATIKVTSSTGKTRTYTVTAKSFSESLVGTYDITELSLYGGTGPEYGGGAVLDLTDKPWDWPDTGGPEAELDNTLTFKMTGITDAGNTYGTIENSAGDDGAYADFMFVGDPKTDVNHFYRKIPKGKGMWKRNYATGTITITFPDSSQTMGTFEQSGTQDLGNGLSHTTENVALEFDLNGKDDWDNIYSDYDKFVERPRKFWIEMKKK